jgi:2-oxo-3-hexenedioate decarboxylase
MQADPGEQQRRAIPMLLPRVYDVSATSRFMSGRRGSMASDENTITDVIATELLAALDEKRTIETITSRHPAFDAEAAYRVSAEIVRRRRARGETPIGRKVGFTNRTIWPEYGVFAPIWAHVYDSTVTYFDAPAGRLATGHLAQPRIEPEIVLHFRSAPGALEDEAELLSHVDWIAHGFEIVQSLFQDWKFRAADTIAAFGLHGALLVGPRRPTEELTDVVRKLRTFTITLARDGTIESRGGGSHVLGSPLLAAAHLLQWLARQDLFAPVQAGELVTTGTLAPPPLIRCGERWTTELSGIELPGLDLHVE